MPSFLYLSTQEVRIKYYLATQKNLAVIEGIGTCFNYYLDHFVESLTMLLINCEMRVLTPQKLDDQHLHDV